MRVFAKGFAIVAIAGVSLPAFAATLQPIEAEVFVNRGQGFQRVTGPTQARIGDVVMSGPGGVAHLVYDDGCKVNVNPGGVVAVQELSPCLANAHAADLALPAKAPAVEYYDPTLFYAIGGSVLAVGGITALILTRNDESPASP